MLNALERTQCWRRLLIWSLCLHRLASVAQVKAWLNPTSRKQVKHFGTAFRKDYVFWPNLKSYPDC